MIFARGGILMYVLLLSSIVTIAVIIERLTIVLKARKSDESFTNNFQSFTNTKEIQTYLNNTTKNSPLITSLKDGVNSLQFGEKEATKVIENRAKLELRKLEKHSDILSTMAAISPMIGFLGTATGMVKVFMNIGNSKGGIDISMLANGIWEAMLTTIGGLIVGIIAIVFYNYIIAVIDDISSNIEETSNKIFSIYNSENRK